MAIGCDFIKWAESYWPISMYPFSPGRRITNGSARQQHFGFIRFMKNLWKRHDSWGSSRVRCLSYYWCWFAFADTRCRWNLTQIIFDLLLIFTSKRFYKMFQNNYQDILLYRNKCVQNKLFIKRLLCMRNKNIGKFLIFNKVM